MYVLNMKDIRKAIEVDTMNINLMIGDVKYRIELSWQKTGYGRRCFFVCPSCRKRFIKIYVVDERIRCQNCADLKPYYGIQYTTKGGYVELEYRMRRYSLKHDIRFAYPFDYEDFLFDSRMEKESFRCKIKILQALENMRQQAIFFKSTFTPKQIKAVLSYKHPTLLNHSINSLKNNYYLW